MDDEYFNLIADGLEPFVVESWEDPESSKIKSLWEWPEPEDTELKIAICGAGGTGKKKLAHGLANKLHLPVIESVARTCHTMGFKINKSGGFEDEMMIFLASLWEQLEYDEFVSAGSIIDVVAYLHYYKEKTNDPKLVKAHRVFTNVVHHITHQEYTVVFYLPLTSKPAADGVRSVDMKFQSRIDQLIKYYLEAFDVDFMPISGGTKRRLDVAWSYLDDFGLLTDRDL